MNIIEQQKVEEELHNKLIHTYTIKLHSIQEVLELNAKTELNPKEQYARTQLILQNLEKENDLIPFVYEYIKTMGRIHHNEFTNIEKLIANVRILNMRASETFNYLVYLYMIQRLSIKELFQIITENPLSIIKEISKLLQKNSFSDDSISLSWALELYE